MGKSSKSRMDEDFHSLTNETEAKRIALEKLSDASQAYLKAISKSFLSISLHAYISFHPSPTPTFNCSLFSSSREREPGGAFSFNERRAGSALFLARDTLSSQEFNSIVAQKMS